MSNDTGTIGTIVMLCGIVIHFITFVGIFTRLENRLTKLETMLAIYNQNFKVTTHHEKH